MRSSLLSAPGGVQVGSGYREVSRRLLKALLLAVGIVALILGLVGLVIPVIPAMVFLPLSLALLGRVSPRFGARIQGWPPVAAGRRGVQELWRRVRSAPWAPHGPQPGLRWEEEG